MAALMAVSCSQSKSAVIDAAIEGADTKNIIVSQLSVNQLRFVDSVKTDKNGKMQAKIAMADESPNFYYLSYNGKRLASLVLKPGDKVKVVADTLGKNVSIEGSQESALMQKYDVDLANAIAQFAAETDPVQMSRIYVKYKQGIIKSIMQNPYSFANVQALYQLMAPGLPVFGDANDHFMFQRVHDSLQTLYPNSVYVKSLQEQIKSVENMKAIAGKIADAQETSFPNITLPDVNAKDVALSSLEGKPFILMFWTVADPNQKMFNNDLLEIYNKYKSAGLEIYQVSVDTDKTAWATAVKEQNLPWISVCDGKGANSIAVATYNVASIPSIYVFDKKGDIIAHKDLFSKARVEEAVRKAIR